MALITRYIKGGGEVSNIYGVSHKYSLETLVGEYKLGDNIVAKAVKYGLLDVMKTDKGDHVERKESLGVNNNVIDIIGVYGSGEMYNREDIQPATFISGNFSNVSYWNVTVNNYRSLSISDGITSIGDFVFAGLNQNSRKTVRTHGLPGAEHEYIQIWHSETYDDITGETVASSAGFFDTEIYRRDIDVSIGSDVKKIGLSSFARNLSADATDRSFIRSMTVKGNVEYIDRYAFQNQGLLNGIDFHHSPTIVQGGAFNNCYNLRYVNLSDDWKTTDFTGNSYNIFNNCYNLERISPKNVIHDIRGNMYCNCNKLTQVTILDSTFGRYTRTNAMYVDLFAGDPEHLDEEGYLITEVNENSIIDPEVLAYNWKDNWHRIIAYYTDKFVHLYHMGKHIQIREYTRGALPLKDEDVQYFLKFIKTNEPLHNQTPLFLAHKGNWYQVCY